MTTLTDILTDMVEELKTSYRKENLTEMEQEETDAIIEDYVDKVKDLVMKVVK